MLIYRSLVEIGGTFVSQTNTPQKSRIFMSWKEGTNDRNTSKGNIVLILMHASNDMLHMSY